MFAEGAAEIAHWARHAFMTERLRMVCELFSRREVTLLPVKGMVLTQRLYGSQAERPFADVDVLVSPWEFRQALSIARREGWPIRWDSRQLMNANFFVDGVAFDMAASMGPPGTSALGVRDMLARAVPWEASGGFRHVQPEWHDHVLLMSIDAFKDKLASKPWSREDLLRMVSVLPFDPDKLVKVAEDARLVTMLSVVTEWVLHRPSPGWELVRQRLLKRVVRRRYVGILKRLLATDRRDRRSVALGAVSRAVSDSYTQAALALGLGGLGALAYHARRAARRTREAAAASG